MSKLSNKSYKPVEGTEIALRVRLDYQEIAKTLMAGHPVFIANCTRKMVYYAKKRLQALTKKKIFASPALDRKSGEEGYYLELEAEEIKSRNL
jgi:phosphoribosyl-dephospho-CoA transferase